MKSWEVSDDLDGMGLGRQSQHLLGAVFDAWEQHVACHLRCWGWVPGFFPIFVNELSGAPYFLLCLEKGWMVLCASRSGREEC